MANEYAISKWVSMEALRLLQNQLQIAQVFNTDDNSQYTQDFPVGEVIQKKLPQKFLVTDGLGYQPQSITRKSVPITLNQVFGIHFGWDSFEKVIKMERSEAEIREQYIEPAVAQLAQEIDSRAALFAYQNTNNIVGVLGTDPTTTAVFAAARQRLIENACPAGGKRIVLIPPAVNTALQPALASYFNPSDQISQLFKEGSLGKNNGFDFYESVSLYNHAAGVWAGAVTTSSAGQSGASLAVTCTTGDTFNWGDVFSMLNVNPVNPMTRRRVGSLAKQFVVTAPTIGVANAATLQISPAIVGPGDPYQNVDALPVNGAALTLFPGTAAPSTGPKSGQQGLALHRNAFALVGVKLEMPKMVEMSSQTRDPQSGLSIRFTRTWDSQASEMRNRWDMCMGFGALYPDNCAVRILCA